jgi:hypothetical protein
VVDAPLDDCSVACFDEMTRSTDTRFIIITHITMALSIAEKSDPQQKPTTFPTSCHLM